MARTLRFAPGTILAIDRGYVDYQWFRERDAGGSVLRDADEGEGGLRCAGGSASSANGDAVRDQIIGFPRLAREGEKPVLFRRVEIWDKEKEETIVFLSNLLTFGATTIAAVCEDRWQIEEFFKALKET